MNYINSKTFIFHKISKIANKNFDLKYFFILSFYRLAPSTDFLIKADFELSSTPRSSWLALHWNWPNQKPRDVASNTILLSMAKPCSLVNVSYTTSHTSATAWTLKLWLVHPRPTPRSKLNCHHATTQTTTTSPNHMLVNSNITESSLKNCASENNQLTWSSKNTKGEDPRLISKDPKIRKKPKTGIHELYKTSSFFKHE